MDVEQSSQNLEIAESLRARYSDSKLHLVDSRTKYQSQVIEGSDEWRDTRGDRAGPPEVLAADTSAQLEFLRKLKFQYLEEYAKDKYVKIIVNDDPPEVTAEDNDKLQTANSQKKEDLKASKARLAEKYEDIQRLAPLVEQDYEKARNLTEETVSLAKSNLDAQLTLVRLRQAHPHPRYTVAMAEEQLASQVTEMQQLDEELQKGAEQVAQIKEAVKAGIKEVDRLRAERADLEKEVRAQRSDVDDSELPGLYEWFTNSITVYRSLFGLDESHSVAENELRLTYNIDPSPNRNKPRRITIDLVFVPNTRQLADVQVEGLDEADWEGLTNVYVHANDVAGLVWAVVSRARRIVRS